MLLPHAPRALAMSASCGRAACDICAQPATSAFAKEVYHACARIPAGCVLTYGSLASALQRPGAARAVGSALKVSWPRSARARMRLCRAGG
jgi:O6-methylguanine-DNA--protein-cysteine methyltransferase